MTQQIKLEVGAGKKPRDGFLTCDVRDLPNVDICCCANNIPLDGNTVSEIYSRHLIEHFSFLEFLSVLVEWNRVLAVNGQLYIICPNVLWHLKQILEGKHESFYCKDSGKNDRFWGFGSLFGWQQDEYDIHKFGYYFELLRDILLEFGFDQIEDLTNHEKSLEKAPWHLEVRCKKVKNSPAPETTRYYQHFDVSH